MLVQVQMISFAGSFSACPTATVLENACLLAPVASCSQECALALAEANSAGSSCVGNVIDEGASFGFSPERMCSWRGPCKLTTIGDLKCSQYHISPAVSSAVSKNKYTIPSFTASSAVVMLHSYSMAPKKCVEGACTWGIDSDDPSQYTQSTVKLYAVAVTVGALVFLEYVLFACCHTPSFCFSKRPGFCCLMACRHKHTCFPKCTSKIVMLVLLLATVTTALCAWSGRIHFHDAASTMIGVVDDVAKIFKTVELQGGQLTKQSLALKQVASSAQCVSEVSNNSLDMTATGFSTAIAAVNAVWDGVGEEVTGIAEYFNGTVRRHIDNGFAATIALFLIYAISGIVAVVGKSACLLRCSTAFGAMVLLFMSLLFAAEFTMSVVVADFCAANPMVSLAQLVNFTVGGQRAATLNFYLDCGEGRGGVEALPLTAPVVEATRYAALVGMQSRGLRFAQTCAGGDLTVLDQISSAGLQVLGQISDHTRCAAVNPLLLSAANDALCGSFIRGLHSLWATHAVASVLLLLCLHFALFLATQLAHPHGHPGAAEGGRARRGQVAPRSEDEEKVDLLKALDTDGDGVISLDEFDQYNKQQQIDVIKTEIKEGNFTNASKLAQLQEELDAHAKKHEDAEEEIVAITSEIDEIKKQIEQGDYTHAGKLGSLQTQLVELAA